MRDEASRPGEFRKDRLGPWVGLIPLSLVLLVLALILLFGRADLVTDRTAGSTATSEPHR